MRAMLSTEDRLVLDHIPWFWTIFATLFTLVFLGVGLGLLLNGDLRGGVAFLLGGAVVGGGGFAAMVRRTRIDLDRRADGVSITRRTVLGTKSWALPLSEVERADLQRMSRHGGATFRPVLILRAGGIQVIDPVYTNGGGPARMARRINDWLDLGEVQRAAGLHTPE